MFLVTGAAGKTGQAVIKALSNKGVTVKAMVRKESQKQAVQSVGAEHVLVGNMEKKEDYLEALSGVRALYHICPNMHPDEMKIGEKVIEAAQEIKIDLLGYHSVLHPQTEKMPHHWQKLRVEEMLFESGLPYTILQPATYMQNVLAAKESIVQNGIYQVPYPVDTRLSMIDLYDLGEAAATVLTNPGHEYAIYELVGVGSISPREAALYLSEVMGFSIEATALSLEAWESKAQASALGAYQKETLKKMFAYYANYWFIGNNNILTWLLGKNPTNFNQFAKRAFADKH